MELQKQQNGPPRQPRSAGSMGGGHPCLPRCLLRLRRSPAACPPCCLSLERPPWTCGGGLRLLDWAAVKPWRGWRPSDTARFLLLPGCLNDLQGYGGEGTDRTRPGIPAYCPCRLLRGARRGPASPRRTLPNSWPLLAHSDQTHRENGMKMTRPATAAGRGCTGESLRGHQTMRVGKGAVQATARPGGANAP